MNINQALAQAYKYHQSNRLQAAERLYRTVLAKDAKNGKTWHLLGLLLHQTGRDAASVESLRRATELDHNQALYHESLGLVYLEMGQLDKALDSYQAVVAQAPTDSNGHFMVGQLKVALGKHAEALDSLKRAVSLKPGFVSGWLVLGRVHEELGNLILAQEAFQQVVQLDSSNLDGMYGLGKTALHLGQNEAAEKYLRAVVDHAPNHAEAQRHLGLLLKRRGDYQGAEARLKRAIQADPNNALAHNNLGTIYGKRGAYAAAVEQFCRATQLQPDFAQAYYNLGVALSHCEELEQAAAAFKQAARLEPDNPIYHYHVGAIPLRQGKEGIIDDATIEAGVISLRRAVQLKPDYVEAYYGLGVMLAKSEAFPEAQENFQTAINLKPNHAEAYYGLGQVMNELSETDGHNEEKILLAVKYFQQALQIKPDYAEAHYELGLTWWRLQKIEAARQSYQHAIQLAPHNKLWQLERDLLCPAIMQDERDIDYWRDRIQQRLSRYAPQEFDLSSMIQGLGYESRYTLPPFDLAYHGRDDRSLKTQYATLFRVSDEAFQKFTSRHQHRVDSRYRIGFLVTKKHESGLNRFVSGIMNQLRPEKFTVVLICHPSGLPEIQPHLTRSDIEIVTLAETTTLTIQNLKEAHLDLIYFWEIGTDPLNYFLPFFRLAPVQCTSWGTPTTTAIPSVDYFISSRLFEDDEAEQHYSENLIQLETLGMYYHRPDVSKLTKPRSFFGLNDDTHVYFCTQNLKKFHPEFDHLIGGILRRDPSGKFLAKEMQPTLQQKLLERWQVRIPDVLSRIEFVPRRSYTEYLNLMKVADVILDTIHYSGGTTSFEAIAVGTPIVTLPGEFMRGRMTYGCYQRIGVLDTVAHSPEEYVSKAVRLTTDRAYQARVRAKILAANPALYEDMEAVREIEQFFERALKQQRKAA